MTGSFYVSLLPLLTEYSFLLCFDINKDNVIKKIINKVALYFQH